MTASRPRTRRTGPGRGPSRDQVATVVAFPTVPERTDSRAAVRASVALPDDLTTRLLLDEDVPAVRAGRYVLPVGPVQDVVRRLGAVVDELRAFAPDGDTAAYARVIHALARDLLSATGTRGSVWQHPAHAAFVEEINGRWSAGAS